MASCSSFFRFIADAMSGTPSLAGIMVCFLLLHQLRAVIANPLPVAEADPEPNPQQNIYAPFSGAIYIIAADGQVLSGIPSICPANAQQVCGNLHVWNWCCPSGYTCSWMNSQQSSIGCCPAGSQCNGTPQVVTQTVTIERNPTAVIVASQPRTMTQLESSTMTPTSEVLVAVTTSTATLIYGGPYCSTMTATGPNLPTTASSRCGTILIVSSITSRRDSPFHGSGMLALSILMTLWALIHSVC
ncbi:hypothetical protein P152DRAFT_22657 [Eremomyces bilateralis CBS 781.70]|uniref:GPI anchored protein n=1 Tax=Eremomyces bilateralis CBS 781.70 TaxID=1392243 RepID=A0A6G1GHG2_9PEZI|nr:uncharacterized protein P152DRAFT_22657 [Eremomyces bilateralis CBS 781.70]KAF1817535.1 hypothetical protein P152DRAFT_22657 [Eremomyces bilateralis CBS 781.70]